MVEESSNTSAPSEGLGSRPVKCPACGAPQPDLRLQEGRLYSRAVQVIGYVCAACGRTIHWGARKGLKRKKKPHSGA